MQIGKDVEVGITVKIIKTGQTFTFKIPEKNKLVLLHPRTGEEVLEVEYNNVGEVKTRFIGEAPEGKSLEDFRGCLEECIRELAEQGPVGALDSAYCLTICSTIIINWP